MKQDHCDVCGRKLRKGSTLGVCRTTPACSAEYHVRYRKANRADINARMRRYMRQRRQGGER